MNFLPAFFCFPRMQVIRWAVEHRQPVDVRQCAAVFCYVTLFALK